MSAKRMFKPIIKRNAANGMRKKKIRAQSFTAMVPNMTTLMALCCGMTAIRFALLGLWRYAIVAVLISAVLDALDGRLARLLNSASRFGAELDSFSDFLSFGVSPALIIYMKTLHELGDAGWAIALFFTVCMALRLARFNVMSTEDNQPAWRLGFFTGVPAPLGGFLGIFPLVMSFAFPALDWLTSAPLCAFFMILSAGLMVSRIPTFSLKKIVIGPSYILLFMLVLSISIGMLYAYPWYTLSLLGIAYISTIPFSIRKFRYYQTYDLKIKKDEDIST